MRLWALKRTHATLVIVISILTPSSLRPAVTSHSHEANMAAPLGPSFFEVCAFEREAVQRAREVHVKLASAPAAGAVKFADAAGAYHYDGGHGQVHSSTSNRFISWSTSGDALQLAEHWLDGNLLNNAVRLRFDHCQVVPGGVAVAETRHNLVVLVATNQSVHRIPLPHPKRTYRSDVLPELHVQSVLTDVAKLNLEDACHSAAIPADFTPAGGAAGAGAVWLSRQGDANYALASPAGGVVVVTLPAQPAGDALVSELKTSWVKRRLSAWIPSAMRGEQSASDCAASLAALELDDDTLVLAVCLDHKLRAWSLRDQVCVLEADLLDFMPVVRKGTGRWTGSGHRLRLSSGWARGPYLAAYLAAPHTGQLVVLRLLPAADGGKRYGLEHVRSLFCAQETLVDFTLTPGAVWAMWLDDDNNALVKYVDFERNVSGQWNRVFAHPPPEEEVHVGVDQDPRETYLNAIFSPLRFTAAAIVKALQIFRRGPDVPSDVSWEGLKKEVTLAVENQIQSSVTEIEFSQEEYRQLQVEFWSKLYACCLKYQELLATPLAISASAHSGMVCVLKKGFPSFLVPCFAIDHLYLCPEDGLLSEDDVPFAQESSLGADAATLMSCLRALRDGVSSEMASHMEDALRCGEAPGRSAEVILDKMLAQDSQNVTEDIQSKLQDIRNPMAAILVLLRELDPEKDLDFRNVPLLPGESVGARLSAWQSLSSASAVSLVCQALCRVSATRTLLCRDALILLKLCLRLGQHVFPGGGSQLLRIQQEVIPATCRLLSSYFLLEHLGRSGCTPVADDAADANLQHLSALHLNDTPALTAAAGGWQSPLEMFYQSCGRRLALRQVSARSAAPGAAVCWSDSMAGAVQLLAQLIWPCNSAFFLPECLMANCQYTQLQDYVRLIAPWCRVNTGSCRFMLAQCYLANGEGHKALQCFQDAAGKVEKEDFLMRLAGAEDDRDAAGSPTLRYYNKVLRLLEDVGLPQLVIQLATLALAEAVNDVGSQAALWTRIFKHHLDLGHNSEAYQALIQNPDSGMQLDCLRQLVVVLCERAQLHDLVHFSYVNLHDEVVAIIESRARGVDLLAHNYYELLYAFHINRHNYRKAGTVMLELAVRLGREVRSLRGLKKQVNCFLAAINCLRLIRPEYAWMVLPVSEADRPGVSPKRNWDGDFVEPPVKRQVEILELRDLEKEFLMATCRLALAQHQPQAAAVAGGAGPAELLRLLLDAGLFMCARRLCAAFQLPLTPLFDALTFRCVKLQFGGDEAHNEAWLWLAANQLSSVVNTKESSAADEAWRLLSWFLSEFPSPGGLHHRQVLVKLLSHGLAPPDWLVKSYKEVDPAALLRLYLNFDLLEAAAELVMEYVDALLGSGHQYFGIKTPLSARNPCVWLPYTPIDQLLTALKDTQANGKLHDRLRDKLAHYHKTVASATKMTLATR